MKTSLWRRAAGDDIALEVDGEDIRHRDFVETDAVRLHEEQAGMIGHTNEYGRG